MSTEEQRQRYVKAKVALALYAERGHVPKEAEITRAYVAQLRSQTPFRAQPFHKRPKRNRR